MFDPTEHPHRRRSLLTGDWVFVSPHRAKRPWQGDTSPPSRSPVAHYDPNCHLCPGNTRANGERNPNYAGPFVFSNDFAALLSDTPAPPAGDPLSPADAARGEARVICFSPDHAATLPDLDDYGRRTVVDAWCAQSADLGRRWQHVQLFENKGAMMGCSSPHPRGQVWASDFVPTEVAAGHYNRRRASCEEAAAILGVDLLRDATPEDLERLHGEVLRRARHVVTENARVLAAADALRGDDLKTLGTLMAESHASMRDDFEITVPAVDRLAEIAHRAIGGEGGARMTGGGFGGAVVAVMRNEVVDRVRDGILAAYRTPDGSEPLIMVDEPAAGAGRVAS